jgi:hypothetical protein
MLLQSSEVARKEEVRTQLDIAIQWGRCGELFDFDASTGQLTPEPVPHP